MTINYYLVGGAVRDELMGLRSKDIDYAVEAPSYEAMREDILARGHRIFQERPEFFAIRASHPDFGGVDFTLCRKEGFYSDNRHPDNVEVGTIYDDLARRDFTVNAIAKVSQENVPGNTVRYIDPHGGQEDLRRNLLRCVGNTRDRLTEDPLRLLRAMRFHIVRGFNLDESIRRAFFEDIDILAAVIALPTERIYEELSKCYEHNSRATQKFFRQYELFESAIFGDTKLTLVPRIKE